MIPSRVQQPEATESCVSTAHFAKFPPTVNLYCRMLQLHTGSSLFISPEISLNCSDAKEMQWDKVPRGTSQGIQKTCFYRGMNLLAQINNLVVLQTKQKMPSMPFNIGDFFLFHNYSLRTAWNTLCETSDFCNFLSVNSSPLPS